MNTAKKLTGKKIKVGIKNGMTVQDFCEKYDCNPEELWVKIGKFFTIKDAAKQVWNEIEANDKKKRKPKTSAQKATIVANTADKTPDNTETTAEKPIHSIARKPTLEELKESEAVYSNTVIELEKDYKKLHGKREKGRDTYQQLREEIHELKKMYQAKWSEAQKIIRKDREIVDQMNAIYAKHKSKQAALEEIRGKIKEMSKIVLCVYGNREIAPFDETSEVNLDDTGHDELFNQLREQEEAEDFRPKDLRVVARAIKIVTNLTVPVEIIFENEEIQEAYEVFTKSA